MVAGGRRKGPSEGGGRDAGGSGEDKDAANAANEDGRLKGARPGASGAWRCRAVDGMGAVWPCSA
jgi:hypothetical protein